VTAAVRDLDGELLSGRHTLTMKPLPGELDHQIDSAGATCKIHAAVCNAAQGWQSMQPDAQS
jgi:hypothetical protein